MNNLLFTLISIMLTAALIVYGMYYGADVLNTQARDTAARALIEQARQIYMASSLYAEEHNGIWPDSVDQLKGRYLRDIPQAPAAALASAGTTSLFPQAYAAPVQTWMLVNDPTSHRQLYMQLSNAIRPDVCQAVADIGGSTTEGKGVIDRVLDPRQAIQCVSGGTGWPAPTFVWVTPGSGSTEVCAASWNNNQACRYLADGTLAPGAVTAVTAITVAIPSGTKLARLSGADLSFSDAPYPVPSWKLAGTSDVALTGMPLEYPLDWGIQGVPTPLGWTDAFSPTPPGKAKATLTGRSSYSTEVYATLADAQSASVGMCRGQSADISPYEYDCGGNIISYTVTCRPSGKQGGTLLKMEKTCSTLPGYSASTPTTEYCGTTYTSGSGSNAHTYQGTVTTCALVDPSAVPYPADGRCQLKLQADGSYAPYPQDLDCASRSGRAGCPVPAATFDSTHRTLHIEFGVNGSGDSCAPTVLNGCTQTGNGTWTC